jgi:proteic killer suppression protein
MIVSFRCPETEYLFRSGKTRFWSAILSVAERKLTMLDAAAALADLRSPPGNRLEFWEAIGRGNAVFVSTPNGEFASSGA